MTDGGKYIDYNSKYIKVNVGIMKVNLNSCKCSETVVGEELFFPSDIVFKLKLRLFFSN